MAEAPDGGLEDLLLLSDLDSEVQCPACGWCSRWPAVEDDRPTVSGPACPRCGATWEGGAPGPDVVVDAAKTAARRAVTT